MQRLLHFCLFLPLLAACQQSATPKSTGSVYPDSVWQRVQNPVVEGWKINGLNELKKFVSDSTNATGMLAIRAGKILFEYGDTKEISYIASCRKSVLSMLYGPFVKNGSIDLTATIQQMNLDDIGGLLPIEKKATIKDLLVARSGVYHAASNEGDASAMAPPRGSVKPGSYWLYNNWDFNIAGFILELKTGKTIYQLVDSVLAKPLHMQDWNINDQRKSGDTSRSRYLAYHMWFSTRDMARIGYLMLKGGKWKDQQIIPADWVKQTTTVVTTHKEAVENKTAYFNFGYGYLWWIWDTPFNKGAYEGAYTASGAFGQFITVFPKLDLVVAFKTKFENGKQTPTDIYLRVLDKLINARDKK